MDFFRRKDDETYNEMLMREAGLEPEQESVEAAPADEPPDDDVDDEEEWEVVVEVEAPQVSGDAVVFVALRDGSLVVEEAERDQDDLAPFADAVEAELAPPYRARADRLEDDTWEVGANPISGEEARAVDLDAEDDEEQSPPPERRP